MLFFSASVGPTGPGRHFLVAPHTFCRGGGTTTKFQVAFVHQHLALVPSLTVLENMRVTALKIAVPVLPMLITLVGWTFIFRSFRRHTYLLRQGSYFFDKLLFRTEFANRFIGFQVAQAGATRGPHRSHTGTTQGT